MAGGCRGVLDKLQHRAAFSRWTQGHVAGLQRFGALEVAERQLEYRKRAEIAFIAAGDGALIKAQSRGSIGCGFAFRPARFENRGETQLSFGIFPLAQDIAIQRLGSREVALSLFEFGEMLQDQKMVRAVLEPEFVLLASLVGMTR